jgi:hypothetical protein
LYAAVFTQLDPGLPVPPAPSEAAVDLRHWYVVPDVAEAAEGQAIPDTAQRDGPKAGRQPDDPLAGRPPDQAFGAAAGDAQTSPGDAAYRLRQPLGIWLASAQRCLLVGGTGSGESAALRFVTLDLLDEDPQLADLAARRAYGVRRLELPGGRRTVAEIAELDARQQHQIARIEQRNNINPEQFSASSRCLRLSAFRRVRARDRLSHGIGC